MNVALLYAVEAVAADHTVFYTGLVSVAGTLLAAYAVYRSSSNATKANDKNQLSEQQRLWTQQAMNEASQAKTDAQEAKAAAKAAETAARIAIRQSGEATERAIAAEERLSAVESLSRSLMLWIEQIVAAAHDEAIPDSEVRRLINGGPADLRTAQQRLRRGFPQDDS